MYKKGRNNKYYFFPIISCKEILNNRKLGKLKMEIN